MRLRFQDQQRSKILCLIQDNCSLHASAQLQAEGCVRKPQGYRQNVECILLGGALAEKSHYCAAKFSPFDVLPIGNGNHDLFTFLLS